MTGELVELRKCPFAVAAVDQGLDLCGVEGRRLRVGSRVEIGRLAHHARLFRLLLGVDFGSAFFRVLCACGCSQDRLLRERLLHARLTREEL